VNKRVREGRGSKRGGGGGGGGGGGTWHAWEIGELHRRLWWGDRMERDHLEDPGVDG